MTSKLIYEAIKNGSKHAVLVASESGAPLYSKLGFITDGQLKSYCV